MTLVERDQQNIWHPYTQMKTAERPLPIVKGRGALLIDENGKSYIDAVSSWWVNLHGHAHPYIAEKVAEQLRELEHVIFAGFTHPPAIELAEQLLELLPVGQSRVFYSDNGSTAVEIALKMAIQYFHNKDERRKRIIAFDKAFHGETFGAMAASGDLSFNNAFRDHLFEVWRIPVPVAGCEESSLAALREHLETGEVCAFIFEPLVLGAGGMIMYEPEVLNRLISLCHQYGVLCIADEVMTGFGRTGRPFACGYLSEQPDLVCLSKGLTGGTLPLAVTTCTREVFEAFWSDDKLKTFFHGHSFTANPVGCAAALASLDLLFRDETQANIREITRRHAEFSERISDHSGLRKVRQRGTILAVEFNAPGATSYFNDWRDRLYYFFLDEGVLLRPLGNVIYVMPPYCITGEQLQQVYNTISNALEVFAGELKKES